MLDPQDSQDQFSLLVQQVRAESERRADRRSTPADNFHPRHDERPGGAFVPDVRDPRVRLCGDEKPAAEVPGPVAVMLHKDSESAPHLDRSVADVMRPVFSSVASDAQQHSDSHVTASTDAQRYYDTRAAHPFCSAVGSGTGHLRMGVARTSVEIDFWHYFTPDETRRYWFYAETEFDGAYEARSDTREGGSLQDAHAQIAHELNVHQGAWFGWRQLDVLDVRADGIDLRDEFIDAGVHSTSAHLHAGEGAWVVARVRLDVEARGSSAHAELDFGRSPERYLREASFYIM